MDDSSSRAKRASKPPSWMQEVEDPDAALEGELEDEQPQKLVYHLLQKSDIDRPLVGRQVFVYWEEYDMWYRAKVKKIDMDTMTAVLFYPDTDEEEPDAKIAELVDAKHLAFKETRPVEHVLGEFELEYGNEFAPAEKRKRGRPPKGQERPRAAGPEGDDGTYDEDFDEDEDEAAPEESDPSYDSAEGKRKRGRGEGGVDSGTGGRPARASAPGRGRWEDDDEEAEAQRLLTQAGAPPAAAQNDPVVREKVVTAFTEVLEGAAKEVAAAAPAAAETLPKPAVVANVVENELARLYGGTSKEYKAKHRTLFFNLKAPGNTELRAHVLRGDITPAAFVRMTATELASKELADYRAKKEEEALKMSVLDAEAAAKFSTAAALDAGRDSLASPDPAMVIDTLPSARDYSPSGDPGGSSSGGGGTRTGMTVSPRSGGGGGGGGGGGLGSPRLGGSGGATFHRSGTTSSGKEEYDPESVVLSDGGGGGPFAAAPSPAKAIDWASIKAQAVHATAAAPTGGLSTDVSQQLEPFGSGLSADAGVHRGGSADRSPLPELRPSPPSSTTTTFNLPSVDALRRSFLPAPTSSTLRPAVWSSEVVVPGVGDYHMVADAIAGGQDFTSLLGSSPLQVRGRLSLAKLASFLSELHLSKHRLAMLGVLRSAPSRTPAERGPVAAMVAGYASQDRAGVGEPFKGVEVYLVPPGELASRLLEAGQHAEPSVAAGAAVARGTSSPTVLLDDQMVALVVYKKGVVVPRAAGSQAAAAAVPAATVPMTSAALSPPLPPHPSSYSMPPGTTHMPMVSSHQVAPPPGGAPLPTYQQQGQQQGQQQPQPQQQPQQQFVLPAGLDMSAISALAAAFGVAQQPPPGPPHQ